MQKETVIRLLKNETCFNCQYHWRVAAGDVCTIHAGSLELPSSQTCDDFQKFEKERKLNVTWTLDNSNPTIYYNDKERDNKETTKE